MPSCARDPVPSVLHFGYVMIIRLTDEIYDHGIVDLSYSRVSLKPRRPCRVDAEYPWDCSTTRYVGAFFALPVP